MRMYLFLGLTSTPSSPECPAHPSPNSFPKAIATQGLSHTGHLYALWITENLICIVNTCTCSLRTIPQCTAKWGKKNPHSKLYSKTRNPELHYISFYSNLMGKVHFIASGKYGHMIIISFIKQTHVWCYQVGPLMLYSFTQFLWQGRYCYIHTPHAEHKVVCPWHSLEQSQVLISSSFVYCTRLPMQSTPVMHTVTLGTQTESSYCSSIP